MKPFRSQITLTACLMLMLIWTSNSGYAQNSQTLIAKTKSPNYKHNFKHKIRRSARLGNDLDNSSRPSKDEEINLIKDRLKFEMLTGGKWVTLDSSNPTIETTNQPLRISYVPLKDSIKEKVVVLTFKKYHSELKIQKEHATLTFKASDFSPLKANNAPNNLPPEVLSRLPAGMYTITIAPEKEIAFWLKVTDVPPEPPIISSIDTRLAEQGELSLKLKNVVVGDKITYFVNGEAFDTSKIKTESRLEFPDVLNKKRLPPGKSIITAQLRRKEILSDYSIPVAITSRATEIITRKIDVKKTDFLNNSTNRRNEDRLKSETEFKSIIDKSPEDLPLQKMGMQLKSGLDTTNEMVLVDDKLQAEVDTLKKCLRFQDTGWEIDPIFSWPSETAVSASHVVAISELQKLKTPILAQEETIIFQEKSSKIIVDGINDGQEFTLDITFKAMDPNLADKQLRRIVSLSQNTTTRNFTLGQIGDDLVFRFRENNATAISQNGLSKTHKGSHAQTEGIHFYKLDFASTKVYNVVISYADKKLRFWVNQDEKKIPEAKYDPNTILWSDQCRLILGNELGQPLKEKDRLWNGSIHSFSIRKVGVTTRKPDIECMKFISTTQTIAPPSGQTVANASHEPANNILTQSVPEKQIKKVPDSTSSSQSEDKLPIQEFAFPYPAAFPISRFSRYANQIETEGAVLDQMRLAIAKDGRYQLDFDAHTTMRAEIKLQLFIKLKDKQWYPITLPRQTILPANYTNHRFGADNGNETSFVSITGYAPILVNQQNQITDIRRRGSATFGTRPVDSSY